MVSGCRGVSLIICRTHISTTNPNHLSNPTTSSLFQHPCGGDGVERMKGVEEKKEECGVGKVEVWRW